MACSSNCNCSDCNPCPPCDNALPETCEPLGITGAAARLVVEDSSNCKKTIAPPVNPSLLVNTEWADGSASQPICLPEIQDQVGGTVSDLVVMDENQCLHRFRCDQELNGPKQILAQDDSIISFQDVNTQFGEGCGYLTRECPDGEISYLEGLDSQVASWDSGGNPVAIDASSVLTSGSLDAQSLFLTIGTTTVTADVEWLVLRNAAGGRFQGSNISVTMNRTVSGAGGLDTGAIGANQWWWMFVIYNPSTVTYNGLASLSPNAPTLPAGYTFYRRVGGFFINSAGTAIADNQFQSGRNYYLGQFAVFTAIMPQTGTANASTVTAISGTLAVPAVSLDYVAGYWVAFSVFGGGTTGTTSALCSLFTTPIPSGLGGGYLSAPGGGQQACLNQFIPLHNASATGVQWNIQITAVGASLPSVQLWVRGIQWNFV